MNTSVSGKLRVGNANKEVGLQVPFSEPGNVCSIQFDIRLPPDVTIPIQAEALITWFTGGNTVTRRVSVGAGVTISGVAEAVLVKVKDVTIQSLGSLDTEYDVTVIASRGTRGGNNPAILLPPQNTGNVVLLAGTNTTIPIPVDAGVVAVNVGIGNGVGLAIADLACLVQQEVSGLVQKVYDPRDAVWVPVALGATLLRLFNDTDQTVRFSVTFAVDG